MRRRAEGRPEWGVPKYNGGRVATDPEVSRVGSLLAGVSLPNTHGAGLSHLLVIETRGEIGPVDFRSLTVRESNHLRGAARKRAVGGRGAADGGRQGLLPPVSGRRRAAGQKENEHNNCSGARKATGTYFTKAFAVDHLLDHALDPAVQDHLGRLAAPSDEDG